jgi:hypothetical protein
MTGVSAGLWGAGIREGKPHTTSLAWPGFIFSLWAIKYSAMIEIADENR